MRVLLDESLPRTIKFELIHHEVKTVPEMGWAGKSNGELLGLAEKEFEVFLTADQNLEYQQNLVDASISIVVLAARTNRLDDLRPLIPGLLLSMESIKPGEIVRVVS